MSPEPGFSSDIPSEIMDLQATGILSPFINYSYQNVTWNNVRKPYTIGNTQYSRYYGVTWSNDSGFLVEWDYEPPYLPWYYWFKGYPEPYEDHYITVDEIIDFWVPASKHSKVYVRMTGSGIIAPQADLVMFFRDIWNDPENITQCLYERGEVQIGLAKGRAYSSYYIQDFGRWYFDVLTFKTTYGLEALPVFNILFVTLNMMSLLAITILTKYLVSGWL